MKHLRHFFVFSALIPISLFPLIPAHAQGTIPTVDSEEWAFLTLINTFRAQNGSGPLQISVALENSSQWMSNDMATKNYFSHTDSLGRDPGTRIAAFGYPYFPWGENIAAGLGAAQDTFNQFLNACDPDSTGSCTYAHRQNMVNPSFKVMGIARSLNLNSTYGWYWVTDFGGVVDTVINPTPTSAPVIGSFTASPSSITAGQSSTLGWSASGATSVSIDNGIGDVSTVTSKSVSPGLTTTYTLTATNSAGSSKAMVTVSVSAAAPSAGSAAFLKTDSSTQGAWKSAYGGDGYNVIGDSNSYPSYVTVTPSGNASWTWAGSTTNGRALQKASVPSDHIASCWYTGTSFTMDLSFHDAAQHELALYLLDWDYGGGRSERVDILDGSTNNVLDTRTATGFSNGEYLVWNVSGHVIVRVTNTNPIANAVVSGVFFGAAGSTSTPPPTTTFVKTDLTTIGSWQGVYGADGYNVIGDNAAYPSYVTVTPSGNLSWTWASSTTDPRALQKASAPSSRVAACWYSAGSFTVDLSFHDSNTHQVAIYFLDWDRNGRTQRVDILDGSGNVLDTRNVSGFLGGQYLVWNLSGHAVVRVTNTGSPNAVLNGIFFR